MTINDRDARADMNTIPKQLEPMYSSSRSTLEHLFLSDVEQRRIMLKLMSARGRQMAASVFNEANQLKPRTCFYNRPLHVLLSTDESTKLALEQVNKHTVYVVDCVLRCDGTRARKQITSFGETDESV
jgi:hypothetical protein